MNRSEQPPKKTTTTTKPETKKIEEQNGNDDEEHPLQNGVDNEQVVASCSCSNLISAKR